MNTTRALISYYQINKGSTRSYFVIYFFLLVSVLFFSCKTKKISTTSDVPSVSYRETPDESKFKKHFIDACRHKALGNAEQAIEQFNIALSIFPKNAAALYETGNLYRYKGKLEPAVFYAKAALKSEPGNAWYHLLYIDCLHGQGKFDEAAAAAEHLVKLFPNNFEYYSRLADEYAGAGNFSKALHTYEEIEKRFGADPENLLERTRMLRRLKRPAEAELILIRLIKENPKETTYYTNLAELYQENRHSEKAFEIYKQLTQTNPNNPYVHLSLADFYRSQRNDSAFFRELKTAFGSPDLEVEQKSKILISFYSISEEYPEYRSKGVELCRIMLQVHPEDARSRSIYADYLMREGQLNLAREQYCLALKAEPGIYVIWQEVMKIDAELRDYQSLEEHSKEAADLFPAQPLPLFYNGAAKVQLKKYEEGIAVLNDTREIIALDTQLLSQVYINLGDAYNALKKYPESDQSFEEALKLEGDNVYLLNNYSYYLSVRKAKLQYAEKLSAKANQLDGSNPQFIDTYAWIMYQQGRFNEAKEWIEKALEKDLEKNGVILEHYADILFRLQQVEKAVIYWKKAKETGRHSEFIDRKIADKKIYE